MIKLILFMFLLVGCSINKSSPDVDSLWVNPALSSIWGGVDEEDEKKVMDIFYEKYDLVSKDEVENSKETNGFNMLMIVYEIDGKTTNISMKSKGYGTISIENDIQYVKFYDGVHEQLLEYIENRNKQISYYSFSKETREWLDWYNSLTEFERPSISNFPNELREAINNGFDFKY